LNSTSGGPRCPARRSGMSPDRIIATTLIAVFEPVRRRPHASNAPVSLITAPLQAGGFGDLLKQFSAFDFGGTEFDTNATGRQPAQDWEDRERWVNEALTTPTRRSPAPTSTSACSTSRTTSACSEHRVDAGLPDRPRQHRQSERLRHLHRVPVAVSGGQAAADRVHRRLNRNFAILNKVDPRQLTGPFQLDSTGSPRP
jgi:hypothetical protein